MNKTLLLPAHLILPNTYVICQSRDGVGPQGNFDAYFKLVKYIVIT